MNMIGANPVVSGALDHTGKFFPLDSLAQTITPDATTNKPGVFVATDGVNTWTRTLTYDGAGALASISYWVRT